MKYMMLILLALTQLSYGAGPTTVTLVRNVVTFVPGNNAEVKRAFIGFRCLRGTTFWEDMNDGLNKFTGCYNYNINGVNLPRYNYEQNIELKKIGPNQFVIEDQKVTFTTSNKGHLCIRVVAGLDNGEFAEVNDQWSLFGFCTVEKLPFSVNEHVYNNRRKATLGEFKSALINPIPVKTKIPSDDER